MKLTNIQFSISASLAASIWGWFNPVFAQTQPQQADYRQSDRISIVPVHQLKDVSPTDWAYDALRSLTVKYNCISGFQDGTYRGNHNLSRYEFAVGLNSCFQQISTLIGSGNRIDLNDLNTVNRLLRDFESEINLLDSQLKTIEKRIESIERQQFSTTAILTGEAVFGVGSILAGSTNDGESEIDRVPFLGSEINLELSSSFTGEDELSIDIEASNFPDLVDVTDTFQGELSFGGSSDNVLELDSVVYTFPIGDLEVVIGATGLDADDIAESVNYLESDNGGDGAISSFGGSNPIYETAEDTGIGIIYEFGDTLELSAGYLADAANEPIDGRIFNVPYGAIVQAIISPSDRLDLAFTYAYSRNLSDSDTGSNLANLRSFTEDEFGESVPTVSNSYSLELSYELSDFLAISAWGGLSKVTTLSSLDGQIERGTQDVWNWAITLAFPDLGREGNLGGIVIGAQPWVTNSSIDSLGTDDNISLHWEAFYEHRLSDNITITPGIVWITAPDNSDSEDDLVIGAIRTTFRF